MSGFGLVNVHVESLQLLLFLLQPALSAHQCNLHQTQMCEQRVGGERERKGERTVFERRWRVLIMASCLLDALVNVWSCCACICCEKRGVVKRGFSPLSPIQHKYLSSSGHQFEGT